MFFIRCGALPSRHSLLRVFTRNVCLVLSRVSCIYRVTMRGSLISARVVSHSLRPFSVSLDSRCQYLRPLFVCVDSGQGSAASCHSFDFGGRVVLASLARGGKCSLKWGGKCPLLLSGRDCRIGMTPRSTPPLPRPRLQEPVLTSEAGMGAGTCFSPEAPPSPADPVRGPPWTALYLLGNFHFLPQFPAEFI